MPRKQIYGIKAGFRVRAGDAQVIGERLGSLSNKAGRLEPEVVVEDAKNEASPLHPYFTWDDTEAARQHRLEQARLVIRSITVSYEELPSTGPREFKAYVKIGQAESGDAPYMQTLRVFKDSELRTQLVAQALSELQSWRERYNHIAELSEVFAAIDVASERPAKPKKRAAKRPRLRKQELVNV